MSEDTGDPERDEGVWGLSSFASTRVASASCDGQKMQRVGVQRVVEPLGFSVDVASLWHMLEKEFVIDAVDAYLVHSESSTAAVL